MKLLLLLLLVCSASAAYVSPPDTPSITTPPDASATHVLEKRVHLDYIEKQKEKIKAAHEKLYGSDGETSSDAPSPWIRTIYGSIKEIVHPTVVQGVTISAKPPKTTNGLEPWITLQKDGSPKTVRPQLKNGHTKNASPTYDTWFATPTTVRYTKQDLKAHNMEDDEVYEEIEWIEEDKTYRVLNPILRCTPDYYYKKGLNKDVSSEPFCYPRDNQVWKLGRSYFVTWFSKYFEEATYVRLHLSAVKPSLKDKGLRKRSAIMENGGKITTASFFITDWIRNEEGMYPFEVLEDFLDENQMDRKVLLSIQPDTIADEDFDGEQLLKHSMVLELSRPGKVYKGHNEDLEVLHQKQKLKNLNIEVEDGLDYEKYFAIMGIPTFVIFLGVVMYLFVKVNKTDLHLKQKKARGLNHNHRRIPFKSKKTYSSGIPLKDLNKAD